jgi:hypothetical protein
MSKLPALPIQEADVERWTQQCEALLFLDPILVAHRYLDAGLVEVKERGEKEGKPRAKVPVNATAALQELGLQEAKGHEAPPDLASDTRTFGSYPFSTLVRRREAVLRYLHAVVAKKAGSEASDDKKLAVIAGEGEYEDEEEDPYNSPTLRIVVLSLFPLIKSLSRTDPELKGHLLLVTQLFV